MGARKGELSTQDVRDYAAARVAPFKEIRIVVSAEQIPNSPSGKILRRELVERERMAVGQGLLAPISGRR
ncbi:MAG: hypothetical protein ACKVQA_13595 [Burkholderiales bacterium]